MWQKRHLGPLKRMWLRDPPGLPGGRLPVAGTGSAVNPRAPTGPPTSSPHIREPMQGQPWPGASPSRHEGHGDRTIHSMVYSVPSYGKAERKSPQDITQETSCAAWTAGLSGSGWRPCTRSASRARTRGGSHRPPWAHTGTSCNRQHRVSQHNMGRGKPHSDRLLMG